MKIIVLTWRIIVMMTLVTIGLLALFVVPIETLTNDEYILLFVGSKGLALFLALIIAKLPKYWQRNDIQREIERQLEADRNNERYNLTDF